MALSVFEPIDPTLTVVTTGLRGQPIYITNWPYGTEDGTTVRALRKNNFSSFVTERGPIVDTVNEITNPSFELDTAGWSVPSGTIERLSFDPEDEYWWEGDWKGQGRVEAQSLNESIFSPTWGVEPGQEWSVALTAFIGFDTSWTGCHFQLQWLNAAGAVIETGPDQFKDTNGYWGIEQDVQMAPASATHARMQIECDFSNVWGEVHVDVDGAIAAMTGGTVAYFDGDSAGAAWTGTPHASSSFTWT